MSFSNYMQIKIIKNLCLIESAVKRLKMHVHGETLHTVR